MQQFTFQVLKCDDDELAEGQPKCHNPKEIDEFISNIQVETWSNYEVIQMNNFKTRPTDREEHWLT